MDSNPPRTRIDQFFNSKKNRSFSPKTVKESSSPSAKGSLEGYLVTSQNEGLSNTQGGVKRSLALEIDLSEEKESEKTVLPLEGMEFKGLSSSGTGTSGAGCSGGGVDGNGSSDAVAVFENPELKKFAMDFLSIYCGNIPSIVPQGEQPNKHKRQGSPSLLLTEGKSSKIRHSVADHVISKPDPETPSCGKRTAFMPDGAVAHETEAVASSSREVDRDNPISKQMESLRKCSRTTSSTSVVNECSTPATLHRNSGARETPISAHGSSMFSPGEAFWNEAIQVVDGLFTQADKAPVQNKNVGNLQSEGNSHHLCKASSKDTLNAPNVDSTGCFRQTGADISLPDKHVKLMDKESSPLPVKHFDFSCEVKNLNESTPRSYSDNKKSYGGGTRHYDCSSVTRNSVPAAKEDQSNAVVHKGPNTTLVPVTEEKKMDILSVDSDRIISDSPNRENINAVACGVSDEGSSSPLSSIPPTIQLDLSNWLPPTLCNIYRRKGILKLYPWQVDCLQVDGVLQKRNLVYCASTSAGKSFVAEILMLRRVLETGKMALLVLPYVSICVEKAEHLEVLLEPLGKQVRSYYGNQGGGTLPKDTSVAVCTIEKANSLINRLLEEDRLSEVGIIVIDELHMVADPHRGYLLELLLTKLRYAAGEGSSSDSSSTESSGMSSSKGDVAHGLQIVGMSATMPNVAAVADWLHAALYQTEFRPVPLEEFIKVGNTIYNKAMEIIRTIPKSAGLGGKDPDHVVQLCNEVVQDGHSVLIFCSSRKGCESTARHISMYLKKFSFKIQDEQSEFTDIFSAIDALRRCPVGLDPVLEETLPSGVAYHHAGLTVEEREIIETCYRKGLVRVLTATSTLAAGVNLPARRVIFRQPRIGRDFIDGTRYKQMAGRAGRTGIDAKGESVLICRPEEVKRIRGLINDSCPPLHSCLSEDKNGMTHAILEVVAGGIVQTANDIHRYVRCTLLNSTKPFEDVVKSAQDSLKWLCHRKFLEWSDDTKLYSTTPLGRAAFGSSLSPEESLIVLDDLSRAREGIVLASDLHLVYLATPINVEVEPDWELYYERFMELPPIDQSVGNRVGVLEPFLMRMAHGAPLQAANQSKNNFRGLHGQIDTQLGVSKSNTLTVEQSLRVCKRFYVALILSKLVQEVAVSQVCEAFKVARGMVQALQENAGRFASMVSLFCERLGWLDLEGLIAKVQNRVSFGVRAEIVELTTIPHVKGARARALYKAGLRTPQAIAEASVNEIAKALFESSSWTAQENIAQRRVQLGVAKKVKNAARKIVLDKAEEAQIAAFNAYQSLGLNVPQFTRPLLSPVSADPHKAASLAIGYTKDNMSRSAHIEDRAKHIPVEFTKRRDNEVVSDTAIGMSQRNPQIYSGTLVTGNIVNVLPQVSAVEDSLVPLNKGGDGNKDDDATVSRGFNQLENVPSVVVNKEERMRQTIAMGNKKSDLKGPTNIASFSGLDSFLDLWESVKEFFFDIHFNKRSQPNSLISFEIHGVAVCWENSPVYYVNLPKVLLFTESNTKVPSYGSSEQSNSLDPNTVLDIAKVRWSRIGRILGNTHVRKFTWNLKAQVQVLKNSVLSLCRNGLSQVSRNAGIELVDGSFYRLPPFCLQDGIDLCIVAWILWPDEERSSNPSLEKEVKKRLSSVAAAAANQSGRWKNQMRRAAHNGCCLRVAQTRALHSFLWNLLVSEELVEPLLSIEIPLVKALADMEDWGIGVDMEGCLKARHELSKKLKMLEKEAYRLAGITFSLFMPADVANVLYEHLKLPIPEGNKGKQHASTDKHSLDLLRFEHPIVPVIKEHRSLAKLLNSTLGSICSLAKLSMRTQKYTIQGRWLQTSTATGRLSMEEPNLQCVEHMVEFRMQQNGEVGANSDPVVYKINARDFFVPTEENWLLVTADYSQIELRLMAHFSKDRSLIELLSDPNGDAFTLIASRWTGKPENEVSSQEREQTKRLVYGILYGMGSNSLSEQLNCSADEAKHKIQSFKNSFPGVASWLHEAVSFCRQHGFVQTLKGRKRFLSKIKLGDSKEKAKAQRQAVNSICQGSAADIIKIAMINIYSVITGFGENSCTDELATKFSMLKGNCRILLQVHDELVVEVDPFVVKEAGLLLKTCMESAVSLLVPLQVKVKVGRTWGSLEPFDAEQVGNDLVSHP